MRSKNRASRSFARQRFAPSVGNGSSAARTRATIAAVAAAAPARSNDWAAATSAPTNDPASSHAMRVSSSACATRVRRAPPQAAVLALQLLHDRAPIEGQLEMAVQDSWDAIVGRRSLLVPLDVRCAFQIRGNPVGHRTVADAPASTVLPRPVNDGVVGV